MVLYSDSYCCLTICTGRIFIEQVLLAIAILSIFFMFRGNITNFLLWPRVLSNEEILNLAGNCECPIDYFVAMTVNNSVFHGAASYSFPKECPKLSSIMPETFEEWEPYIN